MGSGFKSRGVYEKARNLSPDSGLFLFCATRSHDLAIAVGANPLAADGRCVVVEDPENLWLLPYPVPSLASGLGEYSRIG